MTKHFRWAWFAAVIVLGVSGTARAQDGGSCPALVEDAVQIIGSSCAAVGRDEACYGHTNVAVTFQPEASGVFAASGDTVPLIDLQALVTQPADPAAGTWGVALMKVQADLPDDSEDALTFVLFGDAEVTNTVDPALAGTASCTAIPTGTDNINVRSGPGTTFGISDVLIANTTAAVTGRTEAGDWLRIEQDGSVGWVAEWVVAATCAIEDLPVVVGGDSGVAYTHPMQAFTLSSGAAACSEAPSGLLINAPQGQRARVMVNGVQLEFASAGYLEAQPDGNLTVSGLRGTITATAQDTTVTLHPGFRTTVPLSGLEASGPPTDPEPFTDASTVPGLLRSVVDGAPFDLAAATDVFAGAVLEIQSGEYSESITSTAQTLVGTCEWYWGGEVISEGYAYDDVAVITMSEDAQSLTYAVDWGEGTLTLAGGMTYTGTIGSNVLESDITLTFMSPTAYEIEILDRSINQECIGDSQTWQGSGNLR